MVEYIVGRNNLAVTIFVPYNCPNNCPFCTSKKDYENNKDFSMEEIIKSFRKVAYKPFVKDIVITGGEPFADLKQLDYLLNEVSGAVLNYGKNLYINTTLPCTSDEQREEILQFLYRHQKVISGLNISRHMNFKTKYEDFKLLEDIYNTVKVKIRINSVLFGKVYPSKVKSFINEYVPVCDGISFRADYTKIKTQDDLRNIDKDEFVDILFNMEELYYLGSGGCMVCNNDDFIYKNKTISYHRGMENSLITKGDYKIINDIVIKQNGKTVLDWKDEEVQFGSYLFSED